MELKDVVIRLDASEVKRIIAADVDADADAALAFIRESLVKKVKKALEAHCVPVFEANYRPAQKRQPSSGK